MTNKPDYLRIYYESMQNAKGLLEDAEILLQNGRYARAYALGYTALEEISKSQLAADVFTGFYEENKFLKQYRNHKDKIAGITWAHIDANSSPYDLIWTGPEKDDIKKISAEVPLWLKRQKALYVDIGEEKSEIYSPDTSITQQDAEGIIHVVEVALYRIWEVTEEWGNQIGTKGFMK